MVHDDVWRLGALLRMQGAECCLAYRAWQC